MRNSVSSTASPRQLEYRPLSQLQSKVNMSQLRWENSNLATVLRKLPCYRQLHLAHKFLNLEPSLGSSEVEFQTLIFFLDLSRPNNRVGYCWRLTDAHKVSAGRLLDTSLVSRTRLRVR